MLALLAAIQLAAAPPQDSLPRMSLAEALERAARLDPNYVSATRQIADAEWGRRAALTAFVVPSISAQLNATWYSDEIFNIGTGAPASRIIDTRLEGRLNLFAGLSKFNELTRSAAELMGLDADLGTIEVGKLADLVVLEEDPRAVEPTAISDITVSETWMDGERVF